MFWFKRCPRCSGDLFEESDRYGCFITCMQCGFSKDTTEKLTAPGDIRVTLVWSLWWLRSYPNSRVENDVVSPTAAATLLELSAR